jgi:predicted phage terminase large subunit-like protein
MRFEPERKCVTKYGGDIRTEQGELLCEDRFDESAVAEMERDMGSQVVAAQLQQRPTPPGGNLFKREWFETRWRELPAEMHMVQSWDCTFKDTSNADFVAGHVWGYSKGKFYLIDRIHDRMGLPDTVRCIEALARRWPNARGKLIEDKANGPAVEQVLRGKMSGIIMVTPEGGKVARANAIAPLAEAGNIILPDPSKHAWADEVLEELVTFPFARNDDDVDCMTQAVVYLHDHSQGKYLEAMRRIAAGEVKF